MKRQSPDPIPVVVKRKVPPVALVIILFFTLPWVAIGLFLIYTLAFHSGP